MYRERKKKYNNRQIYKVKVKGKEKERVKNKE